MTIKIELEFIPVSERLPEKSGDYLAAFLQEDGSYIFSNLPFDCEEDRFLNTEYRYGALTHWAALPDLSEKKEQTPADYIWAFHHWSSDLSGKKEESGAEQFHDLSKNLQYAQSCASSRLADHQRRRDMFDKVAQATITIDDGEPSWMPEAAKKIAEVILKESDKFARGE